MLWPVGDLGSVLRIHGLIYFHACNSIMKNLSTYQPINYTAPANCRKKRTSFSLNSRKSFT
jgi:hypothetical protein